MQGCSLGLERLVLETVSRRFLERLISVLKVERLDLESLEKLNVSVSSRSWGFNVSVSVSWLSSCEHPCHATGLWIYHEENNGSDPQETGCQVTDFTSWCFKLRHCGLKTFFGTTRSRLGLEGWTCHLVLVLRVWENGTSRSCDLTSCGHPCSDAPVKILISPLDSVTLTSCMVQIFWQLVGIY